MAEDNNNVESLSYKITVDTSDVTRAKDELRELNKVNKEAQADSKKTITPSVNVKELNEETKALSNAKKATDELANSMNKLNQTASGNSMNGAINAAKKLQTEVNKTKLSVDDLGKVIGKLDTKGLDVLKKEIDSFFASGKGGLKPPPIDEAMKQLNASINDVGGNIKGSEAYYDSLKKIMTKYAEMVYGAGGSLQTLQKAAATTVAPLSG